MWRKANDPQFSLFKEELWIVWHWIGNKRDRGSVVHKVKHKCQYNQRTQQFSHYLISVVCDPKFSSDFAITAYSWEKIQFNVL